MNKKMEWANRTRFIYFLIHYHSPLEKTKKKFWSLHFETFTVITFYPLVATLGITFVRQQVRHAIQLLNFNSVEIDSMCQNQTITRTTTTTSCYKSTNQPQTGARLLHTCTQGVGENFNFEFSSFSFHEVLHMPRRVSDTQAFKILPTHLMLSLSYLYFKSVLNFSNNLRC